MMLGFLTLVVVVILGIIVAFVSRPSRTNQRPTGNRRTRNGREARGILGRHQSSVTEAVQTF